MQFDQFRVSLAFVVFFTCLVLRPGLSDAQEPATKSAPLKVLLVAGGCCHDYATQKNLLKDGIEQRINAEVTVAYSPDTTTRATFDIYNADDWAKGYDVVIHDECSANVIEQPYVGRILAAHRNGTPAVNLHCAMHSYRWGDFRQPVEPGADNAGWYEMIGVQSTTHGAKSPIDVQTIVDNEHPITKGFEDWKTIDEELYNNVRVFSGTNALIRGNQLTQPNKRALKQDPNAQPKENTAVVAWTNEYGPKKTKIFSTSLGHQNETVADGRYLDLVVNGLLWATDNLTAEGKPNEAFAKVADNRGKLIFADEFDRVESQENEESIGNNWSTNSKKRAAGNKQVDLRDGTMHIYRHDVADHAVSVRQDVEFKNGSLELRFMLENTDDSLGLDFGDAQCKTVHAGHLFKVTLRPKKLDIADTKTGVMDLEIRKKRLAKTSTPELKKLLASKQKSFPLKLEIGKWYALNVKISGETVGVTIDGEEAGSFTSAGFAHPTKRMIRLSIPKQVVVDDVKIFSAE